MKKIKHRRKVKKTNWFKNDLKVKKIIAKCKKIPKLKKKKIEQNAKKKIKKNTKSIAKI